MPAHRVRIYWSKIGVRPRLQGGCEGSEGGSAAQEVGHEGATPGAQFDQAQRRWAAQLLPDRYAPDAHHLRMKSSISPRPGPSLLKCLSAGTKGVLRGLWANMACLCIRLKVMVGVSARSTCVQMCSAALHNQSLRWHAIHIASTETEEL